MECKGFSTETFWEPKTALCQYTVLVASDISKEFIVQKDATSKDLGAVLSQEVNREGHSIVFLSKKLTAAKRNDTVMDQECLAIKWTLDSPCYFLFGRKFRLVSDQVSLAWMRHNKETNARVARWFLALQRFQICCRNMDLENTRMQMPSLGNTLEFLPELLTTPH